MRRYGLLLVGILIGGALTFTVVKYSQQKPIAQPQVQQNDNVAHGLENQLAPDISEKQDGDYVYVSMKVDDPETMQIKATVRDGIVNIDGKEQKKIESNHGSSVFESQFHRSFPIPDGVDGQKMQTLNENGKLVLKFPKLKS